MKFLKIFNRLILQQTEDQNVKKMHEIYLKAMDDENVAEQKWQKALKRKRLCICVKDQKTKLVKISTFSKKADRYIKYAQQFVQKSQDEDLDEKDVDKALGEVKAEVQTIVKSVQSGDTDPKKAKVELKKVYAKAKKENPEVAKKIVPVVKNAISTATHSTASTGNGGEGSNQKKQTPPDASIDIKALLEAGLSDKHSKEFVSSLNSYIRDLQDDSPVRIAAVRLMRGIQNKEKHNMKRAIEALSKDDKGKEILKELANIASGKKSDDVHDNMIIERCLQDQTHAKDAAKCISSYLRDLQDDTPVKRAAVALMRGIQNKEKHKMKRAIEYLIKDPKGKEILKELVEL